MMLFRNIFRQSSLKRTLKWGLCDDYEVLNNLGKGSSAKIFQGVQVLTGQKVVIKMFKKMKRESIKKQIDINMRLVQLLNQSKQKLPFVRFIQLLDILHDQSSDTYTMIYKFYHGVPLNQLLQTITYADTLKAMFYLLHTLQFVHSIGLIHRDIKPANILLTKEGPRLFDFGLAKLMDQEEEMKVNNFGTKCYKSPEVIYRMATYNQQVDIWALGLVFAEMLLHKRHILKYESDLLMLSQIASFCHLREEQKETLISQSLSQNIIVSKSKSWQYLANKSNINKQLVQLIKKMLEIDYKKRPSISQILQNPIFKQVEL